MRPAPGYIEKQLRARRLAVELIELCEQLGHPLAGNYVHLGSALLENRAEAAAARELPFDLRHFE